MYEMYVLLIFNTTPAAIDDKFVTVRVPFVSKIRSSKILKGMSSWPRSDKYMGKAGGNSILLRKSHEQSNLGPEIYANCGLVARICLCSKP